MTTIKKVMLVLAIFCAMGMFINLNYGQSTKKISIGDCYLNPAPIDSLSFVRTDLLFTTIECDTSTSKILFIENFDNRQFPLDWSRYAYTVCPRNATTFIYPMNMDSTDSNYFICVENPREKLIGA